MSASTPATPLVAGDQGKSFGAMGFAWQAPCQADLENAALGASKTDMVKVSPAGDVQAAMKIPTYLSEKFKVVLLFNIISVVYIHTFNRGSNCGSWGCRDPLTNFSQGFQYLMGQNILVYAVPLCFLMSGYLFFVHKPSDIPHFDFKKRISARFQSLAIPFFMWNLIAVGVIYTCLQFQFFFDRYHDHQYLHPTWRVLLDMWNTPANFPLWYIQDLLILVCLTPLFYGVFRVHHLALVTIPLAAMVAWFLQVRKLSDVCSHPICVTIEAPRIIGFVFFPVGSYIALRGIDLERKMTTASTLSLVSIWLGLCLFSLLFQMQVLEMTSSQLSQLWAIDKLSTLFGVSAIWFGYDLVAPALNTKLVWPWILWMSNYAMWIYCAHMPVTLMGALVVQDWIYRNGKGQMWSVSLFLIYPVLVISVLLALAVPLSRHCGTVFGLLTGGRG